MSLSARKAIGLTLQHAGEFWIPYHDFLRFFDSVELCTTTSEPISDPPKSLNTKNWVAPALKGAWIAGVSAGGCGNYPNSYWINPQFAMTLSDPDVDGLCTAIVGVMQKVSPSTLSLGFLSIGFVIYRVSKRDLANKPIPVDFFRCNRSVAGSPVFINLRKVASQIRLAPGHYIIVPSTLEPNEEAEFSLRAYADTGNTKVDSYVSWMASETP